jgi:hypothetical protein
MSFYTFLFYLDFQKKQAKTTLTNKERAFHGASFQRALTKSWSFICYITSRTFNYSAVSVAAVLTYRIKRNDVGIRINNAVAVNPKMLTSMRFVRKNKNCQAN